MAKLLNMELLVLIACSLHMAASMSFLKACFGGSSKTAAPMEIHSDGNSLEAFFNRTSVDAYVGSEEKIKTMVSEIQKIYHKFIGQGLLYNNVDNYYRFYEAYKEAKKKNDSMKFEEFLLNYEIKIEDIAEEPLGYLKELMERINKNVEGVQNAMYLISASSYDSKKDGPLKFNSKDKPEFWRYDHIAGIIKFEIRTSEPSDLPTTSRVGYILLDPKYLIKPDVIMNLYKFLGVNCNTKVDFPIGNFKRDSDFVIGSHSIKKKTKMGRYQVGDPLVVSGSLDILYFFKKPYLTFVKNTIKPSLLRPDRTMKSFDNENLMTAELNVSGLVRALGVDEETFSYGYFKNNEFHAWIYGSFYVQTQERSSIGTTLKPLNPPEIKLYVDKRFKGLKEYNENDMCALYLHLLRDNADYEEGDNSNYKSKCHKYWIKLLQRFTNFDPEFLNQTKLALGRYEEEKKKQTKWDLYPDEKEREEQKI